METIGAMQITRVGSVRVVQLGAVCAIIMALIGEGSRCGWMEGAPFLGLLCHCPTYFLMNETALPALSVMYYSKKMEVVGGKGMSTVTTATSIGQSIHQVLLGTYHYPMR